MNKPTINAQGFIDSTPGDREKGSRATVVRAGKVYTFQIDGVDVFAGTLGQVKLYIRDNYLAGSKMSHAHQIIIDAFAQAKELPE